MKIIFKITNMVYAEELNGQQKVVKQIEFLATNPETGKSQRGELAVSTVDLSNFVQFENLTEQDVSSWVVNSLQEAGVYDELVADLGETNAEVEVAGQEQTLKNGVPWANNGV
jgi:hypothetical protein